MVGVMIEHRDRVLFTWGNGTATIKFIDLTEPHPFVGSVIKEDGQCVNARWDKYGMASNDHPDLNLEKENFGPFEEMAKRLNAKGME